MSNTKPDSTFSIIGLSGTNGAGKDYVGSLLVAHFGYYFISVTELLRAEAKKRRLPVERAFLRQISAEWRRQSGLGVLIDKAVEHYAALPETYTGVVIASLRNTGEADRVHELGGSVFWIDADPRIRYERIQEHAAERNRFEEDNKTFEQFLSEEAEEMKPAAGADAAVLNTAEIKGKSDVQIINNGTSEALLARLTEVLGK